jgi:REP element-mobilizing transposase RayT
MNHKQRNRHSIRLKGYDYSQAGSYFVTICTQHRECMFGEIVDGEMILNDMGKIVKNEWVLTERLRENVHCGKNIVMPNHFHGIIVITGGGTARRARTDGMRHTPTDGTHHAPTVERFGKPVSNSIPTIIRAFKSAVTREINRFRQTPGEKLWQRNYYEHVIRDEKDHHRLYRYIESNPLKWELDSLHPVNGEN